VSRSSEPTAASLYDLLLLFGRLSEAVLDDVLS
jgi:hypothetical protein